MLVSAIRSLLPSVLYLSVGQRATQPTLLQSPAEVQFRSWLDETAPPSASPARCRIVTSSATSVPGALRDTWALVVRAMYPEANDPSLSVLLLPELEWASDWDRFLALDKHLRTCRDCCTAFGGSLRLQSLHPNAETETEAERRRTPLPALALSSRVGPAQLRPLLSETGASDAAGATSEEASLARADEEDEESLFASAAARADLGAGADLDRTRETLDRLFRSVACRGVGSADDARSEPPSTEEVLSRAMAWFSVHFGRVHRVLAPRQRRLVDPSAEIERVYSTIWTEAALLCGDGNSAAAERTTSAPTSTAAVLHEPAEPFSSLLVLPSLAADVDAFRRVLRSLTLSLACLGLEGDFTLSGVHPRDTFQIVTDEDGTRAWEMQLAYPLIHLVRKR